MTDEIKRPYIRKKEDSEHFDPIEHAKQYHSDDPFKFLVRYYDRRVVKKGEGSIFQTKLTRTAAGN